MKVCLVHDYLNQYGGAERVLKAIHEIWPQAPIYTTLVDEKVVSALGIPHLLVRQPKVLKLPLIKTFYKYFTLLYPLIFESLDLSEFDLVISSSANFAKGVVTNPNQLHINYCHTPPRFLYHYATETNWRKHWFWGLVLRPIDSYLRLWDFWAAQRVDFFVANSQNVASRIKKFYRREATVIYPPVEMVDRVNSSTFETNSRPNSSSFEYYLVVSRLTAYKNVDLAIRACARLDVPLKIVGEGPEKRSLEKLAQRLQAPVEFLGFVPEGQLADLYQGCEAVLFPAAEEDFGIVPVEAMALGKPILCLRAGGCKETVLDKKTGLFFDQPTVDSLVQALRAFKDTDYFKTEECAQNCRKQAAKFSKERFKNEFRMFVEEKWSERTTR